MKRLFVSMVLILSVFLVAAPLSAEILIKIGSIAPDRSPWNDAIKELGQEWERITGGQVKIKVYPGGVLGSEDDMIRKIRLGALGGAALTNVGLTKLLRDAYVLNIPFMLNSDPELDFLLKKMRPTFESKIKERGFKVVIWSLSGWLNFFAKERVAYPDDMRRHKISFTTGEPEMEQAWKKIGFQVVPIELKDLMMALQSGMVTAFYLPPLVAGSGQYFGIAKHMCPLKVAPLLGGIVVYDKIWEKIPAQFHQPMMDAAERQSAKLYGQIIELEKKTLVTMKQHGLVIDEPPADAQKRWQEIAAKGLDELIGKAFSREIYEQVMQYLKEFRHKK